METLRDPGAKETGESHAGLTALGATGTAADLAGNDQGTDTALSQVVVRRNSWNGHKDTKFGQKALNALAESLLGDFLLKKGLATFPHALLKGVVLYLASLVLRVRCQMRIGSQPGPGHCIIGDDVEGRGPA